jgi:uncharacterized protein (DUF302 family)
MKSNLIFALLCLPLMLRAQISNDWVIVASAKPVKETVELLQKAILEKGFKIFNTIDHAAGAASVGMALRPTMLIIFGSPKGGTPLMNCDQRMGIILPLKFLIWEDDQKQVRAGFINLEIYLKEYDLEKCREGIFKMREAMAGMLSIVEKK